MGKVLFFHIYLSHLNTDAGLNLAGDGLLISGQGSEYGHTFRTWGQTQAATGLPGNPDQAAVVVHLNTHTAVGSRTLYTAQRMDGR